MIISRAPVRIPLGGGGTDLPFYYREHGGFFISAAINKYVHIVKTRPFYDEFKLHYSTTEIVGNRDEIKHNLFRETLKYVDDKGPVELTSLSDVPGNTGLGSSGSFTVALLASYGMSDKVQLAEAACDIEMNRLGEPTGKQDQYIAALGGIRAFTIHKSGVVTWKDIQTDLKYLQSNILLFYTGIERSSSSILSEYQIEYLDGIKNIGLLTKSALEEYQFEEFGKLLDKHWQLKRELSGTSNPIINQWYDDAISAGALGGKLMGAGGGGFFMFYCENIYKTRLRSTMKSNGLREIDFHFDFDGAKIVMANKET